MVFMSSLREVGESHLTKRAKERGSQRAGQRRNGVGGVLYQHRWDYFFILPKVLFFAAFVLIPVLWAFLLSFQEVRPFGSVWVGLDNFQRAWHDPLLVTALTNTIKYTVVTVPASLILALVLATLVHPLGARPQSFFRGAFYLPRVTSIVVIAMVWRWIYQPRYGLLNYFLGLFGVAGPDWLGNANVALWALILMFILTPPGLGVILYLSAMNAIPEELYEAARIDGASAWRQWYKITLPLLKPATLYLIILETIGAFQAFAQIEMMTKGGPGNATTTLVYLIYQTAFRDFDFGLASAQAILLFAIIFLVAFFQYRFLTSKVQY